MTSRRYCWLGNNLPASVNVHSSFFVPTRQRKNGLVFVSKKVVFEQHQNFLLRWVFWKYTNSRKNFLVFSGINKSPLNFSFLKNFTNRCSSRFCEAGWIIKHEMWFFLYKLRSAKGSKWKISTLEKRKKYLCVFTKFLLQNFLDVNTTLWTKFQSK